MAHPEQNQKDGRRSGSQNVQALRVTRALRPPQKRSRIAGLQPTKRDSCERTLGARALRQRSATFGSAGDSSFRGSSPRARMHTAWRRCDSRSKCGPGGWPGPHFICTLSSAFGCDSTHRRKQITTSEFHLDYCSSLNIRLCLALVGRGSTPVQRSGVFAITSRSTVQE